MTSILITGGTGLIGKHLCNVLRSKGYNILILSRNKTNNPNTYYWNISENYIDPKAIQKAEATKGTIDKTKALDKVETSSGNDLYVNIDRRLIKIDIPSIYLIEAKGDYIYVKTEGKNYTVHSTLKKIEDKLPDSLFLKIHRSFIINVDKIIDIDQSPIGRTPRSNPATYTGAFGPIRDWFTSLPESKTRGYKPGRFSFNVKGGRCEACEGDGVITYEMHFLPDVYIQCDECKGTRYNRETLEIKFKDKSISDVLDMSVDEGCEYFENISKMIINRNITSDIDENKWVEIFNQLKQNYENYIYRSWKHSIWSLNHPRYIDERSFV